jgi:hypothetical protein
MSKVSEPVILPRIASKIILLDAWMKNPIEVKVTKHPNADHILAEDARGVVYYAHHARIERILESKPRRDFDNLL